MQHRWNLYELMVEHIETLPLGAEVTRAYLAREVFGGGFDPWHVSYLVLRDMYLHGILDSWSYTPNGRVFAYRKVL